MQPILHSQTKLRIEQFLGSPSHSLLLTGQEGAGKSYVAQWLGKQLATDVFIVETKEGKSSISIDQIRELYNLTRSGNSLAIIIKDSHQLGTEAQNAFLKLLEEPPQNIRFILTAHDATSLLTTIRSRTQHIELLPPHKDELLQRAKGILPIEALSSHFHTSEGLPGKFFSLLEKPAYAIHTANIEQAKAFYKASVYERHLICIENNYEKDWAAELLRLLVLILQSLLKQQAFDAATRSKLLLQSEIIETTAQNLLKINGNPKIHLARLSELLG